MIFLSPFGVAGFFTVSPSTKPPKKMKKSAATDLVKVGDGLLVVLALQLQLGQRLVRKLVLVVNLNTFAINYDSSSSYSILESAKFGSAKKQLVFASI